MRRGSLGERIYIWRRRRGMTQRELAALVGVNRVSLSRIERGETENIAADTLRKLAQALKVKTDYLHGLIDEEDAEADYQLMAVG